MEVSSRAPFAEHWLGLDGRGFYARHMVRTEVQPDQGVIMSAGGLN